MSGRFEFARAAGKNALSLIFPEGAFETLPFEIRLTAPWVGSSFGLISDLKPAQRWELSQLGYTIVRGALSAPQPSETELTATDMHEKPLQRAA